MTRPLSLEDFDRPQPLSAAADTVGRPGERADMASPAAAQGIDIEEERLQAFEKGYRAGWDDAAAAHSGEQGRISSELGQNLQDMSFTYHEAYAALSREVGEVLRGLVDKVFPGAIGAALTESATARVEAILAENSVPVEITVAPPNVARLEALVAAHAAPPLRIVAEPSLGEGQAYLRFGAAEQKVDIHDVLAELSDVVDRLTAPPDDGGADVKELRHG